MRLDSEAPEDRLARETGASTDADPRRPSGSLGWNRTGPPLGSTWNAPPFPAASGRADPSAHVLDSRHVGAAVQPVQDMLARVQIADVVSASDRSTWNDSHPASFPRGLRARCMSARPPPGQIRREGRQSLFT